MKFGIRADRFHLASPANWTVPGEMQANKQKLPPPKKNQVARNLPAGKSREEPVCKDRSGEHGSSRRPGSDLSTKQERERRPDSSKRLP